MKKFFETQFVWILKVVWATLVFYFGISVYVDRVGDVDHMVSVDSVITGSDFSETHFVADGSVDFKRRFQETCLANLFLCVKTDFAVDFSYRQKYIYFSSIVYLVKFFDNKWDYVNAMSDHLQQIKLIKKWDKRRWYTSKWKVTLNMGLISTDREFFQVLSHELFHVFDLVVLEWSSSRMDHFYTEFEKSVFSIDDLSLDYYVISWDSEKKRSSSSRSSHFCSRYGQSDPFEDFAECWNLYINHNALFKFFARQNDVMKKKYAFFFDYFDGQYLVWNVSDIISVKDNIDYRVWDTTRM